MNPAMAGLGALSKQTSQPTGRPPESMAQTMSLAKQMSDMQLADVLAGKSMNIPQYVAMTEAMGRKQLRTAMQGMTAMGSAKQPTEREKLLSEMMPRQQQPQAPMGAAPQSAGLDQLPADNMQGLGLANGGIIAFAGDGPQGQQVREDLNVDVMDRLRQDDPNAFQRMMRRMFPSLVKDAKYGSFAGTAIDPSSSSTVFTPSVKDVPFVTGENPETGVALPYRRQRGASNAIPPDLSTRQAELLPKQDLSLLKPPPEPLPVAGGDVGSFQAADRDAAPAPGVAPPKPDAVAAPKVGGTNTSGSGGGSGAGGGGGSLAGTDLSRFAEKQAELLRPRERSKDYYEALTKPTEDIAKQVASGKEQAQGEFLMNIGAALMSTPNLGIALSKGVQAGLPGLAASRKEINALTKDQRDYQFNIAKAKEARDQGDEMLALNYLKLAEESKYHAGIVGAAMARATAGGGANTFGPKQYQAAMSNAQKEVDAKIGKMNPLDKRAAEKNRDQLIEAAFTRNLEAYKTGAIPATQDPSLELFEKPGGPILTRPQK